MRPEVIGNNHIVVHPSDPVTFYDSPQAVSDRESEAARRAYEGRVHRGTYLLSTWGPR